MTTDNKARKGLLFIGHGSRDVAGVDEFNQVMQKLSSLFNDRLCETGFLEFATPVIRTGFERLLEQGVQQIIAVPSMLMAAGHAKNDIPSEVQALQASYPQVSLTYGVELGVHAQLIQAAAQRIEAAQQTLASQPSETLLMVVGRGASDADANSNISKITRMLWEGMGFGWAETSFIGVTQPLLEDALERCVGLGYQNIIVFPYFLFTGRLVKKIYQITDEFQQRHGNINVVKAGYLNDHPLVIDAFVSRIREVEQGDGNMNCQLCHYRERIVGAEHKVGEPQASHHHHVRGIGTDVEHSHSHAPHARHDLSR